MADNWLSNAWEWLVPGEDDQGIFKNIFGSDDDYESAFDDELLSDLGIDPNTPQNTWEEQLDDLTTTIIPMEESLWTDEAGYEDWIDSWLDATGAESTGDLVQSWTNEFDEGIFSGDNFPRLAGFFNSLLGGANTAAGNVGSGLGGLFNSTLGQLAMLNYMKNKNKDYMDVPVGWGDGGGGEGGSPIDYRVFNLQPALMPGVAYANVGSNEPSIPPPGMKGGGLGDITLARLEPGEFVMTKKATDNIGARNLYKMMKQAEGMG
jgi:hypothetical protein